MRVPRVLRRGEGLNCDYFRSLRVNFPRAAQNNKNVNCPIVPNWTCVVKTVLGASSTICKGCAEIAPIPFDYLFMAGPLLPDIGDLAPFNGLPVKATTIHK